MGNSKADNLFQTNICEKTHSKQTIVSIISKLKTSIDKPVIVIKNNRLKEEFFKDVYNKNGCVFLSGPKILGDSLLAYINNVDSTKLNEEEIRNFISFVIEIIDALSIYIQNKKSYPMLFLSSIFYDKETKTFTILPDKLSKILSGYMPHNEQNINSFCIVNLLKDSIENENELAKSIIYFIYLYFLKASNKKIQRSIIYDIRTFIKGIPDDIAKKIWRVLKGKENINLFDIKELLKNYKSLELSKSQHIPILRNESFINFIHKLSYMLLYKWKLILVIAVIAGIFLYTLADLIYKNRLSDITKDKTDYEVVELYIKSLKELDIEALDSLLYKRAGKDIIKEVSSIFVVKKMTEIYGLEWLNPTESNLKNLSENEKVYGIKDVKINEISNHTEPEFLVSYTKIFGEKGSVGIYLYQEKIKLKKVKNRWFIFKISRKLINQREIK